MQINVSNVSKYYNDVKALDNCSIRLGTGEILGILGRNGAGKTTLIKILMGIINPDSGQVEIDFKDAEKKLIGYLPEERGLYLNMSVKEQLMFIARLNGMNKTEALKSIKYYLKELGISEYLNKKLKQLSKGNKQKIQLISALVHEPEIVILDEPFSGLDPVNVAIFKNIIKKAKNKGKIIILSSHRIEDVEEMCDSVLFLKKGKTFVQGTITDIKKEYFKNNKLQIRTNVNIEKYFIDKNIAYEMSSKNNYLVSLSDYELMQSVLTDILSSGVELIHYQILQTTLNDIFIKELSEENEENLIRD